jgi:hypothetical protein
VIDPTTLPPAERFDGIMRGVAEALAAQHKEGRLVGRLLGRTWSRLRSAGAKVLALAAAYAAGTLRLRPYRERPYRPRPKAPPEAQDAATPPPKPAPVPLLAEPKLPTGFGWLLKRARVAFGRSQMQHLLAQPDMQALIAAVPPIVRHLRPVCRMLGVRVPPGLFPPRRKSRRRRRRPRRRRQPPRKRQRKPSRRAAAVPDLYAAPRLLPPRPPLKPLDKHWIPPDRRHLVKSA